ncbi:MAG: S46 family peptidase [Acidobacteria bacterium]|nr:S46 family peptidase [Acidobacteriota bacterium]MCL5287470.1 S46 family peptidase [Acidobacteriota bacterium]
MKTRKTNSRNLSALFAATVLLAALAVLPVLADEGMWTFDNPPLKLLKEKYGFTPSQEWLDHVRLASVRFNDGGSGSWVSPTGLVLTNHHVALGQLQKVSTKEKDYVANGFFARSAAEELKCPDLELNVLIAMENVTARVGASVKPAMNEKDALKARKAEMAKIEKEALTGADSHVEVVSLYNGAEYWLYRYKKYTDVRLVAAPEQQAAFFGGDPDNFTYPRYDLDFAIFRVYENDKPVESKHYLKWNAKGAADGELIFISGHPGSTERQSTMAQLEVQRDVLFPTVIKQLKRRLAVLKRYAALGPEQARQANNQIFGIENSLKAFGGEYEGLLDKSLMEKKQKEEKDFRGKVAANAAWQKEYGDAWATIERAERQRVTLFKQSRFRVVRGLRLPTLALQIVQYVAEVKKPDGERLDGFHDSELESLKFRLFSPAPVYAQLEEALIAEHLQESLEELGSNDPFVQAALGGRKPADVARELVSGTKLADPAVRKALVEGGEAAVAASTDPFIVLARKIDPVARQTRKSLEDTVQSVETPASEKVGRANFAVYGKDHYPDATFTLRLSYGTVKGYPMNGTIAPPITTFYGLYDRATSFGMKPPFNLMPRFLERKDKLDLSTPLNTVSTGDIIGGNSGSPVINRNAELVGLIFDGNIESLVGNFVYDDAKNRAVAVHSAAIIEALRKLYDAGALADELEGKSGNRP